LIINAGAGNDIACIRRHPKPIIRIKMISPFKILIALILGIISAAAIDIKFGMLVTTILIMVFIFFPAKQNVKSETKTKEYVDSTSKELKSVNRNNYNIPDNIFEWPPTNEFQFDIVGESYYQGALEKLFKESKPKENDGVINTLDAHIVPDDLNPYDDKAVRIDIDQYTVGHLSRDDARSFRRRLGAKKLTGQITKCKTIITGGHILANNQKADFGISLDIKPFQ